MTTAQAMVIIIALAAANLPFFTQRIFFVFAPHGAQKMLAWRLLELLVFYCAVGALAALFESRAYGSVYPQGWEFYAVTLCLFIVMAFPGFMVRYLWRYRRQ